jgi:hypothetical protein
MPAPLYHLVPESSCVLTQRDRNNDAELVRLILDRKPASINLPGNCDQTPLYTAVQSACPARSPPNNRSQSPHTDGSLAMVQLLLERGADPTFAASHFKVCALRCANWLRLSARAGARLWVD